MTQAEKESDLSDHDKRLSCVVNLSKTRLQFNVGRSESQAVGVDPT